MYKLQTKYGWEYHTISVKSSRREIEDALDTYLQKTAAHGEVIRITKNGVTVQTIYV